jgi:mannose-1-phosphate guanylyltransferase
MRALLLAAGLGTRLRPITNSVPKCLVDIDGRPLLDYWIELLSDAGIVDILINLHYMPEAVRSYIDGCRYPANITTVYEERLLGTGGTLLKNRGFFQGDSAMLVHADNLSRFDVRAFIRRYESRSPGVEMTMMTFDTAEPETCGIVELDHNGLVKAFYEKVKNPPGNLANAAVYILSSSVMDFLQSLGKEVIDFSTEVLPHFIGRINTFHNDAYHRDIGTLESLRTARKEFAIRGRSERQPVAPIQGSKT